MYHCFGLFFSIVYVYYSYNNAQVNLQIRAKHVHGVKVVSHR